jgi:hypothetical protein
MKKYVGTGPAPFSNEGYYRKYQCKNNLRDAQQMLSTFERFPSGKRLEGSGAWLLIRLIRITW